MPTGCPLSANVFGTKHDRGFANVTSCGNVYIVGKVRRGKYIFLTWKGDHSPRHVHVYTDGKLVLKWNLDDKQAMKGSPTARILQIISELEKDGVL